jgi:hypothetical protein
MLKDEMNRVSRTAAMQEAIPMPARQAIIFRRRVLAQQESSG